MTIRMADSADSGTLAGLAVEAYAGYVDGAIGDQPNAARVAAAHPGAHVLSIALSAEHDGDCLDVENGAASPSDVLPWVGRQGRRGVRRPVIYASVSVMREQIWPQVAHVPGALRLWTAHYGEGEHICGPKSCGQLSVDADGTQWTDAYRAPGGVVDMSLLRDDFFAPPSPADWVFAVPRGLTARAGHVNVELTWYSPGVPAPEAVHHYQVTIRREGQDVASCPRDVPKGSNPEVHSFGSLAQGTAYEALVRAVAATGHASPWASVTFTTGHG